MRQKLSWTKVAPDRAGLYWVMEPGFDVCLAQVACDGVLSFFGNEEDFSVSSMPKNCQWCGPIEIVPAPELEKEA